MNNGDSESSDEETPPVKKVPILGQHVWTSIPALI